MNEGMIKVLPAFNDLIETMITMETITYEYGHGIDEFGDREVVDVSRKYKVLLQVPRITFMDWVETLCSLKNNGVSTTHLYTKQIVSYKPHDSDVWGYFDDVRGNLLTNGSYRMDKVRIFVYFIKEFNYYVVLRLLSHHDQVTYTTTKSD
jgi:hypothetical protein